MWGWTRGQESFGGLAVAGSSCERVLGHRSFDGSPNPFSYLWKRFLRIFPASGVLGLTVALFGTIAFWFDHGSCTGICTGTRSPEGYLKNNALLSMNQWNIATFWGARRTRTRGFRRHSTVVVDVDLRVQVLSRRDGAGYVWRLPPLARECHRALPEPLGLQLKQNLDPGFLRGWFLLGDPTWCCSRSSLASDALLPLRTRYRLEHVGRDRTRRPRGGHADRAVLRSGSRAWAYLCMWPPCGCLPSCRPIRRLLLRLYIYAFRSSRSSLSTA